MKNYLLVLGLSFLLLTGCAAKPTDPEELKVYEANNDPLEPMNRVIFGFNQGLDKFLLKPAAKGYKAVTPEPAQRGIYNFFDNTRQPLYAINAGLQGEGERLGTISKRFFMNKFLGFFGFRDTASEENVPFYTNDFGQTLYVWGIKDGGPYLVVPFFGPSNFRDGLGLLGDGFLNPIDWAFWHEPALLYGRPAVGGVVRRAHAMDFLDSLENSSTDFYATVRTMTQQNRRKELGDSDGLDDNGKADYEFEFETDDEED